MPVFTPPFTTTCDKQTGPKGLPFATPHNVTHSTKLGFPGKQPLELTLI